jgi:hypothetical protein
MSLVEVLEKNKIDHKPLFKNVLHQFPFCLRYSSDRTRPNLLMLYPTEDSDLTNMLVLNSNGTIIEKESYSILSCGSSKIIDSNGMNLPDLITSIQRQYGNVSLELYEAEDGTHINIAFIHGEWIMSTSRCIDAFRVKWNSESSFGDLVKNHIGDSLDKYFDKDYTYTFTFTSPENHHVITYENSNLLFISRRNNTTFVEEQTFGTDIPYWIKIQSRITIDTANELFNQESSDWAMHVKRGIIVTVCDHSNMIRYKIDYPWFERAEYLRYNLPSLKLSFLACSFIERNEFKHIFSNNYKDEQLFKYLEIMIQNICTFAFKTYKESYIRKQYRVPKQHPILFITSKLHSLYNINHKPISFNDVISVVNCSNCYLLDTLINFFKKNGFNQIVD